ncbi:hypothetical protein [Janthinobacterium fluminis]|uniref:Uncharacterized protein n=1 Tax=Janthinobacterium fluminis TaxID=2987524 RepID=A0ABT5K5A4_9BURK|nr:hypothetical protein [Janthinobacterium fluminis]MDC8758937.1 hypothetical protein [Janthinobacterium fluminis]
MRTPRRPSKTSLAIIERAYRGSLEEQYGHIVWLTRIMKGMSAPTALLLKGDTLMFAKRGQLVRPLRIGDLDIDVLSNYEAGLVDVLAAQVPVYAWHADMLRLGLTQADLVDGIEPIHAAGMPALLNRYDCIWYW